MADSYKIIAQECQSELIEKKSRFIATIRPVETEAEAVAFIEEMKKKYWDARHNCHAYIIGSHGQITRCSDDGEPSGTAGKPMLELLMKEELKNVCVVVTRYFGGTLLGTGGLIRAYSGAVKMVLNETKIKTMKECVRLFIKTDYNGIGKIQYILAQNEIVIEQSEYTQIVELTVTIPQTQVEAVKKELIEATAAKVILEESDKFFAPV
ncbi:MAG: YigZ family protein [Clostridiales bacterium]|nr:YigZ family protein [Clostridiales bacterium]